MSTPDLSLVFPVFDEERNVGRVIEHALASGTRLGRSFEVVVVDDGSRDGSASVIDDWMQRDPRVRVVRHPDNAGYGAALRSGLREARGELVFFSDADLQFDLSELDSLIAHAERFDIVAGYRSPRRDPWLRRAIAGTWGGLVRLLFGLRVRDIDCAFKVFRRRVLDAIPIHSIGAFVNTEILVRASAAGATIHQVPVRFDLVAICLELGLKILGHNLRDLRLVFRLCGAEVQLAPENKRMFRIEILLAK